MRRRETGDGAQKQAPAQSSNLLTTPIVGTQQVCRSRQAMPSAEHTGFTPDSHRFSRDRQMSGKHTPGMTFVGGLGWHP